MRPYSRWFSHLPTDRQEDFEALVRNNTTLLLRLRDLIDEEIESLAASEETEESFDQPDWAFKQAFRNGGRAKLKRIRKLLEFIP